MSEEFLQKDLINNYVKIGENWHFYKIGNTTINQLKKLGIIRSIDYGNVENKRVDGIIMEHKKVIAIVENKLPENFNTKKKKQKAISQEIEVAKKLRTSLFILTDGQETLWINVKTGNSVEEEDDGKWQDLKYPFNEKDPNLPKFIDEILLSINEKNDRKLPKKIVEEDKQKISDLIIVVEREIILEKEITIGEIFDLSKSETNGSKLTKSFINNHQGNIPVYSASENEKSVDYGYIQDNFSGIKYFENCLTWNIDGSVGKVFFRKGKFSLSEKVIPLIVRNKYKENVDLFFLKYAIEKEVAIHNFGFTNKAGKDKIKNIKIKIPITSWGKFDLVKQKEIAEKYKQIEKIKEKIKTELEKIENIKVSIDI